MKPILTKIVIVLVLLTALTFTLSGTTSAQTLATTHQTSSTVKSQAVIPAACGWVLLARSDWTPITAQHITIKVWEYTCDISMRCEADDVSFHGYLSGYGIALKVSGNNGISSPWAYKFPFGVGNVLYTSIPSAIGATAIACDYHLTTS